MAQAQKKVRIEKDRFSADGVRLFNPTKEHGVIYSDGFYEGRYVQPDHEGRMVTYQGNGYPVGYKEGEPLPQPVDVIEAENEALKSQIRALQKQAGETQALLERLLAAQEATKPTPAAEARTGGAIKGK